MSYSSRSPRQDTFQPSTTYQSSSNNSNNNYISSPFDDDDHHGQNHNNYGYNTQEKDGYGDFAQSSPYNPAYMQHNNNAYAQQTHEHSLSPGMSEKALPTNAYAMQALPQSSHQAAGVNHMYAGTDNVPGQKTAYYNGYDDERPSMNDDSAPMRPDKGVGESTVGLGTSATPVRYRREGKRHKCLPCIQNRCGRITCCVCLFLLLVIIVLAIVIVTVFKVPKVNYTGLQGDPTPTFNQNGYTLQMDLIANIQIENPNPLGFDFPSIVATAYYPGYAPTIGGGNITNLSVPKHSNMTIQFPLKVQYSATNDPGYTVVQGILNTCGLLGGAQTDLTFNYDLKVTTKIIGINIPITLKNQHVNFACPANIKDIASGIPADLLKGFGMSKRAAIKARRR